MAVVAAQRFQAQEEGDTTLKETPAQALSRIAAGREAYDRMSKHLLRGQTTAFVIQDEYAFDEKKVVATLIAACGLWRPISTAPQDTLVFLKRLRARHVR
jgi:hypothetical protein